MSNLEISNQINKQEWNNFVKSLEFTNILASWEWLDFQKQLGNKIFRFKVIENGRLVGVIGYRLVKAIRGNYFMFDLGPFIDWNNQEVVNVFTKFLKKEAQKYNVWFYRIGPNLLDLKSNRKLMRNTGFIRSNSQTNNGRSTLIIDLTKSKEELLKEMRKNTRYYIRQSDQKYNIKIESTSDIAIWEYFEPIFKDTLARQDWTSTSLSYMKKQFEYFTEVGMSRMFYAKLDNKIIAMSMLTAFGDEVIYHHSGSLTEYRSIPSMYLLLWNAMLWYKKKGFKRFNMFGVDWSGKKSNSLYGVSLFKKGFGGKQLILLPYYDKFSSPLGVLTWIWDFLEKNKYSKMFRKVIKFQYRQ